MNNFKETVKKINKLYSENRLESSKARLTKVWNGIFPEDRVPFIFNNYIEGQDDDFILNYYEGNYSDESLLYYGLKLIEDHAFIDDDYIPTLFPGCRQAMIPSMFGAEEEFKGQHFWAKPIISNFNDIDRLTSTKPVISKLFKDFIKRIQFFKKYVKDSIITIHMPDLQGPTANAALLMGSQNLILAMNDNPDKIHALLEKITEALFIVVDKLIEITNGEIIQIHAEPIVWIPPGNGFSFSEDLLAVLSPDYYKEFAIPYNNILSKKYGGFFSHSCGSFNHNLKNLSKIEKFIGVNFQVTEQDIYEALKVLGNKAFLVCGWSDIAKKIDWSPEEHIINSTKAIKKSRSSSLILVPTHSDLKGTGQDKQKVIELNKLSLESSKI